MIPIKFETIDIAELQARNLKPDTSPARPVVLVVDDEHVIADTLAVILNSAGYVAASAYNAEAALEMARVVPPDLLITDVVMPGMSGIDLAIVMKKLVPDCQTLLFSGQAATADLLSSARHSGYTFAVLAKPVHPHDLLEQASRVIGNHRDSGVSCLKCS